MVNRKQTRVVISPGKPGRVRYSIILTGENCPKDTMESAVRQRLFMQWIADNPELLKCGMSNWEKITSIKHNGVCWEARAEADVDEDTLDGDF